MDEKLKFRHETIFKVLAWGTVIYFLVMGYSVNQSGLFEWQAPDVSVFKDLDGAKKEQATRLDSEATKLEASITRNVAEVIGPEQKDRASEAAKLRVEAAQLRADIYLAQEERKDGRERAKGLIIGAFVYSLMYPIVVWLVYKRTGLDKGVTEKDVVPLGVAIAYSIFMSIATCWTALATALR